MKCYLGEYTWYIYNQDIFHQLDTLEISVGKCLVDNVVYLNKSSWKEQVFTNNKNLLVKR